MKSLKVLALILIISLFEMVQATGLDERITVSWTASGDDSTSGIAAIYDLRYTFDDTLTEANWDSAIQVIGEPVPQISGTYQQMPITGLPPGTMLRIAIRAADETFFLPSPWRGADSINWSELSNVATARTAGIHPTGYSDLIALKKVGQVISPQYLYSSGQGLEFDSVSYWKSIAYPESARIVQSVRGDFNGDGKPEIRFVLDRGTVPGNPSRFIISIGEFDPNDPAQIRVLSTIVGYEAARVVLALAGDIDGDGDDDLILIYDYGIQSNGKYRTGIHEWRSDPDSCVYTGALGLWRIDGYNARNVVKAILVDIDRDGDADLLLFYDYGIQSNGKYRTVIHGLRSFGDSLSYLGSNGLWKMDGYEAKRIVQAFAADFDQDGDDDPIDVYDYGVQDNGRYLMAIHAWRLSVDSLSYLGKDGLFKLYGYEARRILFTETGYFDNNSYPDLAFAYRFNDSIAIQVFLGDAGDTLLYQGARGWYRFGGSDSLICLATTYFNEDTPPHGAKHIAQPPEIAEELLPANFELAQNYPNPFNPRTTIGYNLQEGSQVTLEVYNLLGQRVITLAEGYQPTGSYSVSWDASGLSSGVYLYRLTVGDQSITKKMTILK